MPEPTHPLQPLVIDPHGTLRFKANAIVRALLDFATSRGMGLNEIACMDFSQEDREQLAQLIGYSLAGFGELSYVSDEVYSRAVAATPRRRTGDCPYQGHADDCDCQGAGGDR